VSEDQPAFLFFADVATLVQIFSASTNEVPDVFRDQRILQITAALALAESRGQRADFSMIVSQVSGTRETTSKIIHRMHDLELVFFRRDSADRRKIRVFATDKLSKIWSEYAISVKTIIKTDS